MAWIGTAGLFASLPMLMLSHAKRDCSVASPTWLAAAAIVLIAATGVLLGLFSA